MSIVAFLLITTTVSGAWSIASAQTKTGTTTTIAMTSGGQTVTSVAVGSVVTLTVTVKAGSTALTTGQVNFCDAAAKYCTDIHLLGTAQLTSAGTAALRFRPGIGSYSYKAVFLGTKSVAGSASGASGITVTGKYPTATSITQSGFPGNYTLSAAVSSSAANKPAPTGNVSFIDTSNGNSVLAIAALSNAAAGGALVDVGSSQIGNEPGAVLTADFNGDGNLDLAVGLNSDSPTVSIMLGDGTGKFTQVAKSPITATGTPVLVQDFNGDGIPDLLLANGLNGSVTVLLGNGDGTFTEAAGGPISTNYGVSPVVAADFNGDGIPDLALAGGYYLVVLLGKGDGTFSEVPIGSASIAQAELFGSMLVGDFNGDGIPDLVTTDTFNGQISVFLGNGEGAFAPAPGSPLNATVSGPLAIGDFNGDGKPDLAVPFYGGNSLIGIMFGNGDGTFQTTAVSTPITVGYTPFLVALGDFNGDGIADIFVGAQTSGQTVNILLGKGDGTFSQMATGSIQLPCCSSILLGDFNGDNLTDIVSSSFYDGTVDVLLTQFIQETASVSNISAAGPGVHQVVASYPGDANYSSSSSATTALTAIVATPVFTPVPGTYNSIQKVTLSDSTPGATIYYSAAGSVTTNGFVQYTGPITVSGEGVAIIQAYATETGYQQSGYVSTAYELNLPPTATPVISLASGAYPSAQTVTISDTQSGTTIYYTTNGSQPTLNSTKYTGPITISSSETLVAAAIAYGYWFSTPASAQYIIDSSSSSFIYTIAGNTTAGYSGDGGQATIADLNSPSSSVLDKSGNLYIADSSNNVVRKVAAGTGIITTIAGTGVAGFSGDGGPATTAQLNYPFGLAFDSAGNLYVSDLSNSRIRKVELATGIITTVAGNGTFGRSGDGGPATSAELSSPYGIAIDKFDNLFIADTENDNVREIVAATGKITTVAGYGNYGYSGDGGPATSASFRLPQGVAVDASENLYIADSGNNVIRKVTASTGVISTFAGNGVGAGAGSGGYSGDGGPAASAELSHPMGVALDGAGNLYVADFFNEAIRKVAASNGYISTVAGNGPQNRCVSFGGDGGPATSATVCYPSGVSLDKTGNLYIAENDSRIRMATVAAAPPTASTSSPSFSISPGTYASPQTVTLTDPTPGAAIYVTMDGSPPSTLSQGYKGPIDVSGSVTIKAIALAPGYLSSTRVTAAYTITSQPTAMITTVAGSGTVGFSGAGGAAIDAKVGYPYGTAFDGNGNFYFSDTGNNVVWMVSTKTGTASVVAGNGIAGYTGNGGPATHAELWSPEGIAVDSAGNIYIADSSNNVVRKVAAATGLITIFAGNGQASNSQAVGDGGPATSAQLSNPVSLAFDKAGNLYIADTNDNRVRMVSTSTGIITTVAGNGNYGPLGDGGAATSAAVEEPNALAFDRAGNLYVATPQAGRIRKVAAGSGIITTVAGNGDVGSSGDGGLATNAEVAPNGLAVDVAGNLYFSDYPDTVREVAASTGLITRLAGNGYYGYGGDGGSATVAQLADPVGISLDASGNLYIADSNNSRIRKVIFSAAAATPVFSVASGNYSGAQTVTITDTTLGAAIYYTTDGTIPTAASSLYTAAIVVSDTETIQAIAVADGYTDSLVASATYTINLHPTAMPAFSPGAGTYPAAQTVTITDGTASATIYYTTNGTTPTTSSSVYSSPISVSQTGTLEAIAVAPGYSQSAVGTAVYTIHLLLTPTMTLTPYLSRITTAQQLTVAVSVSGGNGNPTPAGNISLKTGSYSVQQALASGSATFVLPPGTLPAGTDTLSATYAPDSSSAGTYSSTTQTTTVTVTAPGAGVATISVTPAAQSITNEQSASVSISVSSGSGQPTPTGSVTLSNAAYNAVQSLAGGAVSFSIPAGTLGAGANSLTVGYSGDATYGSASGTTIITVSSVVITVPTPAAVSPGSSATANVTLSAGSNYSGTMNLTCKLTTSPSGAQSLPGCSLNPVSVAIASGGSGTSTLTIQTTGTSGSALLDRRIRWLRGGGSALAAVLLLGIPARRRRWTAFFALLLIIGTAGAIGCGGGGSSLTTTASGPPPTTAGTYTFTVAGTDTNTNVSTSTSVTITVQ